MGPDFPPGSREDEPGRQRTHPEVDQALPFDPWDHGEMTGKETCALWSRAAWNSCWAEPWGLNIPSLPEKHNLGHNNPTFVQSCVVYKALHKQRVSYSSEHQ